MCERSGNFIQTGEGIKLIFKLIKKKKIFLDYSLNLLQSNRKLILMENRNGKGVLAYANVVKVAVPTVPTLMSKIIMYHCGPEAL